MGQVKIDMEADGDVKAWLVLPEVRESFSWVSQVHTAFCLVHWIEKHAGGFYA